ncbi:MAG: hypothetical protein REI94_01805 [Moraxellaceae bacterium]|nr:hypothetical protein [Moraxellaceae bacterium]
MSQTTTKQQPDTAPDAASATERPTVIGDFGQDDAFATESNPDGLRYGEKRHKPGELGIKPPADEEDEPPISVGTGDGG